MTYPMGIINPLWRPEGTATDFTLPFCTAPLTEFQDRCLFISNVDNQVVNLRSNYRYGHPIKKESALTGTLVTTAFGGSGRNHVDNVVVSSDLDGGANAPSIETAVGRAADGSYAFQGVNLCVNGSTNRRTEFESSFSWEAPGSASTLLASPQLAFDRYFAGVMPDTGAPDPRVLAERRRRGSILDAVRSQFQELRTGLDYRDRQRLDLHADYIRQLELDMEMGAACRLPAGIPVGDLWHQGRSMREVAQVQTRLLAQAMACNVSPVGRLEFIGQQNPLFGVPEVDDPIARGRAMREGWGWHGVTHTNPSEPDPITGRPTRPRVHNSNLRPSENEYAPHLRHGMRFFVQCFADLLRELDRFVEGPDGRTALDNTLCVLASDMGDGHGHGPNRMGYVLAGNVGPFRTGYHFDGAQDGREWGRDSDYNHVHVLNTIAEAFCLEDESGAPLRSFGIEGFGSEGPLPVRRG